MAPDTLYAAIKSAPADCSTFTDATQKQALPAHQGAPRHRAGRTGTSPARRDPVLELLDAVDRRHAERHRADRDAAADADRADRPDDQAGERGAAGKANIYVGSTKLPYYLTPPTSPTDSASVLTRFWTAAGPPPVPGIDPTSRNLTMFNPVPAKVADVTVPLLVTMPNATSACAGQARRRLAGRDRAARHHAATARRRLPWRTRFADACFIVAAIDLPLHGITDTATPVRTAVLRSRRKPQCIGATRAHVQRRPGRTTRRARPSPTARSTASGTHFINLTQPAHGPRQPAPGRSGPDPLTKSVPGLAIAPGTPAAGRPGRRRPDAHQLRRPVARRDRRRLARPLRATTCARRRSRCRAA